MLIELFIAWKANQISKSAKYLRPDDSADEFNEMVYDWVERRALKRQIKKLENETVDIKRPVRLDTSKQKVKSGKRKRGM